MDPHQQELPLPFPELTGDQEPVPARMVNEYVYCPRLAYIMWVQKEWADSGDTVEGRYHHRRVDQRKGKLPEADKVADEERIHARSIELSSNRLGLIARLDLVEGEGSDLIPVDYKRGKRPHTAKGAYDPERVQVCAQGMLLEENGYRCEAGILYFQDSRERVRVEFDEELRNTTLSAIHGLRLIAAGGRIPPPLEESSKCSRCSLVGICLPDEVNFLRKGGVTPRPLAVREHDALPLYVQANRASVRKRGDVLEVSVEEQTKTEVRINEVSQLVLMGNVYLTTPTLHELMKRGIPVSWHGYGGFFFGHTVGAGHKNVELRTAQYRASFDDAFCLRLAKGVVRAKIMNARTLLRRNWRGDEKPDETLAAMKRHADKALRVHDQQELLGVEGNAAALYFALFGELLKRDPDERSFTFDFKHRRRRPPPDPVNALLSYAYTLLASSWTQTLSAVGFDPYRGFYHQPRYGRPALSLDLMEPFRPLIAESVVITAINNGEVRPSDFISAAGAVALTNDGRRRFIQSYERRLDHEITHPEFGYKITYRRILEVQARLLGRHLLGEIDTYPNLITR